MLLIVIIARIAAAIIPNMRLRATPWPLFWARRARIAAGISITATTGQNQCRHIQHHHGSNCSHNVLLFVLQNSSCQNANRHDHPFLWRLDNWNLVLSASTHRRRDNFPPSTFNASFDLAMQLIAASLARSWAW